MISQPQVYCQYKLVYLSKTAVVQSEDGILIFSRSYGKLVLPNPKGKPPKSKKAYSVFFFIELGSRRVHLTGITANPNSAWATQQARQFVWKLEEDDAHFRFLIHDRDIRFTVAFDNALKSAGFHIIHTPLRAPDANAYAERWVRTVREECLDHLLIMNQSHLKRVMDSYISYYETSRPHQGPSPQTPVLKQAISYSGQVRKREVLGGIINDYYCAQQPVSHPLN